MPHITVQVVDNDTLTREFSRLAQFMTSDVLHFGTTQARVDCMRRVQSLCSNDSVVKLPMFVSTMDNFKGSIGTQVSPSFLLGVVQIWVAPMCVCGFVRTYVLCICVCAHVCCLYVCCLFFTSTLIVVQLSDWRSSPAIHAMETVRVIMAAMHGAAEAHMHLLPKASARLYPGLASGEAKRQQDQDQHQEQGGDGDESMAQAQANNEEPEDNLWLRAINAAKYFVEELYQVLHAGCAICPCAA